MRSIPRLRTSNRKVTVESGRVNNPVDEKYLTLCDALHDEDFSSRTSHRT